MPQILTPHTHPHNTDPPRHSSSFPNHGFLLLSCSFSACKFKYHCNCSLACLAFKLVSHLSLLVQFASFNTKPVPPPISISNFLHEGSNSLSSKSFSAITSCYCFLFQHVCQVHCLHTTFFFTSTPVPTPNPISIILSPLYLNEPFKSLCQREEV